MIPSCLLSPVTLYRLERRIERRFRDIALPMEPCIASDVSAVSTNIDESKILLNASTTHPATLSESGGIGPQSAKAPECNTKRDIRVMPARPARSQW
jgi:hypothetical protein